MHRRIIQLANIIMPSNVDLAEDEKEAVAGQEFAFKDGARVFNTRPRISSKNGILKGTFFDPETLPQDLDMITRYEGIPMTRMDFLNFIHRISQKKTTLLAIGVDNRIYRLKIRVGLPIFTDLSVNAFDWELPILGYETFWEDVTDFAFYYWKYSIVDGREFWKYDNFLDFYDFNVLKFPLEILDPPAGFNAAFNSYQGSTRIWDSSFSNYILLLYGGLTTAYQFNGGPYALAVSSITSSPLAGDYYISDADTLIPGTSFIFNTAATSNTYTIDLGLGVDISNFVDGSPFLDNFDTIDLGLFIQDLSNLEIFDLKLHTSPTKYLSVSLLGKVTNKTFQIVKLKMSDFTNIGGFEGLVNYLTFTTKDNGTRVTIKINNIYAAHNFGMGMNYLFDNYVLIPNVSGKCEVKAITVFADSATRKRLTINEKAINLTTEKVVMVKENTILAGNSILNLKPFGRFNTMIEKDVSIRVDSDQPADTYYYVARKYL